MIVDEVILVEDEWRDWQVRLDGIGTTWVRVELDVDELERREQARGDRTPGHARWQLDRVHRFADYDLTVDTGVLSPDDAADVVVAALRPS